MVRLVGRGRYMVSRVLMERDVLRRAGKRRDAVRRAG